MLLSYTLPCGVDRVADLLQTLPAVATAANASPPVQIVVVHYGQPQPHMPAIDVPRLSPGNQLEVLQYRGRSHFHMAHARNIGIRAARGEFVILSSADVTPAPHYFAALRQQLQETGAVWLRGPRAVPNAYVVQREELLAAGGFDERFEFYGPEDRDLEARLLRRGGPWAECTGGLSTPHTPRPVKVIGYQPGVSRQEMDRRGRRVLRENDQRGVLTVNEGQDWGQA